MSAQPVRTIVRTPHVHVAAEPPPLNPGDHLSRAEFERRWDAHPEIKIAELVEGVVFYSRYVPFEKHGCPHADAVGWLGVYTAYTPGINACSSGTVRLDFENEFTPDGCLYLERGGKSRVSQDDVIEGAPELVVEIATSSAAYDLHTKKRVYQRSGVQEYLAFQMHEKGEDWFVLREGVYATLTPDETGILKSEVFPGLWLNTKAFWSGDLAAMLATLQEGVASPEHAAFVERMKTPT